ncbi:hypothetical protein GGX14DRAFT_401228 [Mycena pura]|uniref:Uncharacterized protein n=1 Tax=Mycena pura TaxID=153505 RepID=A0AAD6Y8P1_9AGAR|nr:hypothetical protein GGX14DRAFT_401228 [Mycena pura]
MPVSVNKPSVKWLDYLQTVPPDCPHKPPPNESAPPPKKHSDIERTHPPSSSSLRACDAATILTRSNTILTNFLANNVAQWLAADETRIIPEDDYIQPLLNEQAVAYGSVFHDCPGTGQASIGNAFRGTVDKRRSGKGGLFFLTFALNNLKRRRLKINDKADAPPKSVIWRDPTRFAEMLKERVKWESDTSRTTQKAPDYPCLVLCVIEEKNGRDQKPNVIREEDFRSDYLDKANKGDAGARNVVDFLPPLKKYSVDAQCRLVILTDYHTTLLFDVQEAGAVFDEGAGTIRKLANKIPRVAVSRLEQPPRMTLFSVAVKRLVDAKLINIE